MKGTFYSERKIRYRVDGAVKIHDVSVEQTIRMLANYVPNVAFWFCLRVMQRTLGVWPVADNWTERIERLVRPLRRWAAERFKIESEISTCRTMRVHTIGVNAIHSRTMYDLVYRTTNINKCNANFRPHFLFCPFRPSNTPSRVIRPPNRPTKMELACAFVRFDLNWNGDDRIKRVGRPRLLLVHVVRAHQRDRRTPFRYDSIPG